MSGEKVGEGLASFIFTKFNRINFPVRVGRESGLGF